MRASANQSLRGETRTARPRGDTAPESEQASLLVLDGDRATLFPLPQRGEIILGRASDADLVLSDQTASRKHAKILISKGVSSSSGEADGVRIFDLGSRNGTYVNGIRVAGAQRLCRGDVITICNITLVFHNQPRVLAEVDPLPDDPQERNTHRPGGPRLPHPLVSEAEFRKRASEEIERSRRYGSTLTLCCALLHVDPSTVADRPLTALCLGSVLGSLDHAAFVGPCQLVVLCPERGPEEASEVAESLLAALAQGLYRGPTEAQIGYACCPGDGADVDALLSGARAAAQAAGKAEVRAAADTAVELSAGGNVISLSEPAMIRVYDLLRRLAQSDLPVLIYGETGTGKEFAATAVHHWSARAGGPLVSINCAALPESLIESELFGHEKGAFTGALTSKPGLLASAHGGTVFLDEIGELPPSAQAKLLRVLEVKRLLRVGDVREREVDIRVVAATHRDLQEEVDKGRFRRDLLFRLGAATVVLLPLRERPRDLPHLAQRFLHSASSRVGQPLSLSKAALQVLLEYDWPGNVRELKNLIEYLVCTAPKGIGVLEPWHLPDLRRHLRGAIASDPGRGSTTGVPPAEGTPSAAEREAGVRTFRPIEEELRELERTRMLQALEAADYVQAHAAELIAMPRRTFTLKYKQYGLGAATTKGPPR